MPKRKPSKYRRKMKCFKPGIASIFPYASIQLYRPGQSAFDILHRFEFHGRSETGMGNDHVHGLFVAKSRMIHGQTGHGSHPVNFTMVCLATQCINLKSWLGTLETRSRDTKLKLFKVMTVPVLSHGCKLWMTTNN